MIIGSVSNTLEPIVRVALTCVDKSEIEVDVVVDSGFNGGLTLPQLLVDRLGWPFLTLESVVLANGAEFLMRSYRGLVKWKGDDRITTVFVSESQPSMGTAFLDGKELWIQFKRGGDVVIADLATADLPKPKLPGKPLIGLVGGMGAGKSLVSQAFARHGGFVVAGDAIAHEALQQPDVIARIGEHWQNQVFNEHGQVDRKKLGAIVFADPAERLRLEAIVFPFIEERIRAEIAKAQADPKVPFIVLDAAIMLEAGWNKVCSKIVYVHAPRAIRMERLAGQRGWTTEDLARRESAQLPLAVKASRADAAIDNSGSAENTQKQVDALMRSWHIL